MKRPMRLIAVALSYLSWYSTTLYGDTQLTHALNHITNSTVTVGITDATLQRYLNTYEKYITMLEEKLSLAAGREDRAG